LRGAGCNASPRLARAAGIHLIAATQRPVSGCDHRHHQGQLPHPHFPSRWTSKIDRPAPSWASRAARTACWAKATCSIWRRAGAHQAHPWPVLYPTMKSKTWCDFPEVPGNSRNISTGPLPKNPTRESDDPYALLGGGKNRDFRRRSLLRQRPLCRGWRATRRPRPSYIQPAAARSGTTRRR